MVLGGGTVLNCSRRGRIVTFPEKLNLGIFPEKFRNNSGKIPEKFLCSAMALEHVFESFHNLTRYGGAVY